MDPQEENEDGSDSAIVEDGDTNISKTYEAKSSLLDFSGGSSSSSPGFTFKLPVKSSMSESRMFSRKSDVIAARPKVTAVRRSLDEYFDLPSSFRVPLVDHVSPSSGYHYSTFRRLEDSVLRDSENYTLKGTDGNPAKIPARIREIITKNLSAEELSGPLPGMSTQPTVASLQEENRLLSSELNRVEDLLSSSRAERDELGIKYNALSERSFIDLSYIEILFIVVCFRVNIFQEQNLKNEKLKTKLIVHNNFKKRRKKPDVTPSLGQRVLLGPTL
ncbi:rootletin-like [Plakobranchus ocellatus]|uniref:Rootletin-like n=1 Tax=Plakobranchus ocellatus TaxID=259542 RepID=A0AAV4CRJ6_9GAST|nr:rootletin-like [Plakobranchus ocellatus]